jgi:hypothetical protein
MKARTGVAGLLGALVGVWIGSRSVRIYDWRTQWTIPAWGGGGVGGGGRGGGGRGGGGGGRGGGRKGERRQ